MSHAVCRWFLVWQLVLLPGCGFVGLPGGNVRGCYPSLTAPPTRQPDEPPLTRFIAIGDFGTAAEGRNAEVATALQQYLGTTTMRTERVFELGDNFYEHGLIGTGQRCRDLPAPPAAITDQALRVLRPFEFLRDHGIPLTAIAGNHDYGCRGQGLANQVDIDRWLPPQHQWGQWWEIVSGLPREFVLGSGAVQVVVLDSQRMITDRRFRKQSARILEQLLSRGRERFRWRILAGHHPLRTNGTHDGAWWKGAVPKTASFLLLPSHALAALQVPPFDGLNQKAYALRYINYREAVEAAVRGSGVPVTVFLGGHDHELQLLAPRGAGQPFVLVSGSAALCAPVRAGDDTIFAAPKNGFAVISAYARHLDVDFIGTSSCSEQAACARGSALGPHHLFHYRIPLV